MFTLSNLLDYPHITIQCHDNPDADAFASAFAVQSYLSAHGVDAPIVYGGRAPVSKLNLTEMLAECGITATHIVPPAAFDTLVVVDGQYGAGNVTRFAANTVCVIDHHREESGGFDMGIVNMLLGSCSTLLWQLLQNEGFPLAAHPKLATALYYGLYTDTNSLAEINHPLDKDMRDALPYQPAVIKRLRNTNLTFSELDIAGSALSTYKSNRDLGYALFRAEPCDPNILGFISDIALQVDSVDACVVYNLLPDGAKLSIRSCTREIMASEFAAFLTENIGTGGGHKDKAGGFISRAALQASCGMDIDAFIEARTHAYFNSYDLIDAGNHRLDLSAMRPYVKKNIPVGFVPSTAVFPVGTPILVRTLEGDAEAETSDDILFMVGILGEVYPITRAKFERTYHVLDEPLQAQYEYTPTLRHRVTGEVKSIKGFIHACVALGEVHILAAPLQRNTKVFTQWNPDGYMSGKTGDWLAVRAEDQNDVYIIRGDIFTMTYGERK